jgi:hypothetical protein
MHAYPEFAFQWETRGLGPSPKKHVAATAGDHVADRQVASLWIDRYPMIRAAAVLLEWHDNVGKLASIFGTPCREGGINQRHAMLGMGNRVFGTMGISQIPMPVPTQSASFGAEAIGRS